jgi:hypothetical protein
MAVVLWLGAASCGPDETIQRRTGPDAGPTEGTTRELIDGGAGGSIEGGSELPDQGPAADRGKADLAGPAFTILSHAADPQKLAAGGSVTLTARIRNNTEAALQGAEVWIEAKCPDGRLFNQKTTNFSLGPKATGEAKQLRGPYTIVGDWVFTPSLRDGSGAVLATGPTAKVQVFVPPITNPLTGIAGYAQINLSSTSGSCGSHSGAVAIAYRKGLRNDVPATTAIEQAIYKKVPLAPGEAALKTGYDAYMSGAGIPYKSVSIGAGSVLSYLQAGSPVVAHVYNHYVCIYGLTQESGSSYVYFSDGATGYGTSGSWSIGASGHLRKMGWSAFQAKMYGGYIGFAHK